MEGQDFWSELPRDVKAKILDLEPAAKSLVRLKTVCKEWNLVITRLCIPKRFPFWGFLFFDEPLSAENKGSKSVELKFRSVGPTNRSKDGLKGPHSMEDQIMSILPLHERKVANILDCCNGMILFASDFVYYVGNPVTRQRISVPIIHLRTAHSSLVFDPSLFHDNDPFFKVVRIEGLGPMKVHVFCSQLNAWSSHVVKLDQPASKHRSFQRFVYFNRALYSLMSKAMYLVCIENIVSGTQGLRAWVISLPADDDHKEMVSNSSCFGCIGSSSDRFYYSNRSVEGSHVLVWMLQSSSRRKWVLMRKIGIKEDILDYFTKNLSLGPRAFHPNDGAEVVFMAFPETFLSCSQDANEATTHLWEYDEKEMRKLSLVRNRFFPFSPCLVIVDTTTTSKGFGGGRRPTKGSRGQCPSLQPRVDSLLSL